MDISSISGSNFQNQISSTRPSSPPPKKELSTESLTDDQKTSLEEILSNYEGSEQTPELMDQIFSDMEDAGVPMSEDTVEMLDDKGFGPPEGKSGPPPQDGGMASMNAEAFSGIDDETKDTLIGMLEGLLSGELEQDDFDSQVEELGLEDVIGNLFNEFA